MTIQLNSLQLWTNIFNSRTRVLELSLKLILIQHQQTSRKLESWLTLNLLKEKVFGANLWNHKSFNHWFYQWQFSEFLPISSTSEKQRQSPNLQRCHLAKMLWTKRFQRRFRIFQSPLELLQVLEIQATFLEAQGDHTKDHLWVGGILRSKSSLGLKTKAIDL